MISISDIKQPLLNKKVLLPRRLDKGLGKSTWPQCYNVHKV